MLASCGLSGSSFRIRGSFKDMKVGELYIYNASDDNACFDTLNVKEGEFQYKGEVSEPTPFILVFPNGMEQVIFVGPGSDVKYEATANDLKNYMVSGSRENELLNKFREETYALKDNQTLDVAKSYIENNVESPVALYLFDYYFVQNEKADAKQTMQLLNLLKSSHPKNHFVMDISTKLTSASGCAVGKKLVDVTVQKKDKTTKKLWATSKDYNLVVLWATWATRGYDFVWKSRQAYDKYNDSGKLRIVTISADLERYRWEDCIRQDTLKSIEHYCDFAGFESKTMKNIGVGKIPCYILTDKSHKILTISTDAAELDGDLKKYLKDSSVN